MVQGVSLKPSFKPSVGPQICAQELSWADLNRFSRVSFGCLACCFLALVTAFIVRFLSDRTTTVVLPFLFRLVWVAFLKQNLKRLQVIS